MTRQLHRCGVDCNRLVLRRRLSGTARRERFTRDDNLSQNHRKRLVRSMTTKRAAFPNRVHGIVPDAQSKQSRIRCVLSVRAKRVLHRKQGADTKESVRWAVGAVMTTVQTRPKDRIFSRFNAHCTQCMLVVDSPNPAASTAVVQDASGNEGGQAAHGAGLDQGLQHPTSAERVCSRVCQKEPAAERRRRSAEGTGGYKTRMTRDRQSVRHWEFRNTSAVWRTSGFAA